jgi:nitrate/TMAO reductase-like tetraheme cytochrome c subunit
METVGLAIVTLAASALTGGILLFRRRWRARPQSGRIAFFGAFALPVPVLLLGSLAGIEGSTDNSFCASCHAMDSIVRDMTDPESETLAARHYGERWIEQDQCYTCHANSGLLSMVEPRADGVLDAYRYAVWPYGLLAKRGKPYRFALCLDCHGESSGFREEASHQGVGRGISSRESSCVDCHNMIHPAREDRGGS